MRKAARTLVATLLCGSLAAITANPMALAQSRGTSGLPAGSGNPMADLQQQIDALANQVNQLNTQVGLLGSQNGDATKPAVYDHLEQKVGDLVGVQDHSGPPVPWVALTVGNRTVVLQVFPQQLVGQPLWFDGSNCSGNTFISSVALNKGPSAFALAAVHEHEGMVYAADPNTVSVQRVLASVLETTGVCKNFTPSNMKTLPASPVINLHSRFQAPYSIR